VIEAAGSHADESTYLELVLAYGHISRKANYSRIDISFGVWILPKRTAIPWFAT
jgi:hypothetical protein